MDIAADLTSKSAPKIRKAAKNILDNKIIGYEELLLKCLGDYIDKPRSWKTQSEIIRAIGITGSSKSIDYLLKLSLYKFESTALFKDIGFSICLLHDIPNKHLNYLLSILSSDNMLLIAGACSALLYSKYVPTNVEINTILKAISKTDTDEGNIITPRCYIAALAFLWPKEIVKPFLEQCLLSKWDGLVEISQSSLKGIETKYVLV